MKEPVIGVLPLWDDDKKSLWMLPGYMDGITAAGGLPIMLPMTVDPLELKQLAQLCDGFLFTGGHDVSPELYGEELLTGTECCVPRDIMERSLLRIAMSMDKPVLGICRGIQLINAALGGTLYQDLPTQYPSEVNHHMTPPYDTPIHDVQVLRDTPLYFYLNRDLMSVNSYHHQAVKTLAPCLQAMAYSTDGLVEALYHPDYKFLWAVQWHPEFSYASDPDNLKLLDAFCQAASANM